MDVSKIIKLTVAGMIAILLTGGILYVRLQQDNPEVNAVPVISESGKSQMDEKQILESLSAPASSEQKETIQEESKIMESLSTPAEEENKEAQKSDADILNSLSAPAK